MKDLGKLAAHATPGGVVSVLNGGKFGHGFASAGFVQAMSPVIGSMPNHPTEFLAAVVVGGTASKIAGGKFANGAVTAAMSYAFGQLARRGPVTGSGKGAAEKVIVPGSVKVEASGFATAEDAALAAGAQYGADGVTRRQEVELGLTQIAPGDWGYLTPGWGPVDATQVDPTALFDAYRAAGLKVHAWMHGHWDSQQNFSAADFSLVWGRPNSTYLVNSGGEVRVLRDQHLRAGLNAMRGSTFRQNLQGLQGYYETAGLPGDKV